MMETWAAKEALALAKADLNRLDPKSNRTLGDSSGWKLWLIGYTWDQIDGYSHIYNWHMVMIIAGMAPAK